MYRLEKRSKMEEYRQRIREKKVVKICGQTEEEWVAQALLDIEGMQICVNGQACRPLLAYSH